MAAALTLAGIPFLRAGRDALRAEAEAALARGDEDHALALLLTDRDDWAQGPGPTVDDARAAMRAGTLREAMAALAYGPVADYFAFRWSDPTYLSGLALLDAHAGGATRVLELACGIGHFLRELAQRGIEAIGVDVVFSKLWLCRRFVAPDATLICLDAAQPLPLPDAAVDLAFCHDALHYLPDTARAVAELRRVAGPEGAIVLGHVHNAGADNLSAGAPLDAAGYAALLDGATLYDDAELRAGRPLRARGLHELKTAAAVALVAGRTRGHGGFADPVAGATLRRNPLLRDDGSVAWPSARYEQEYAHLSDHLTASVPDDADDALRARRRLLVDLPEAW